LLFLKLKTENSRGSLFSQSLRVSYFLATWRFIFPRRVGLGARAYLRAAPALIPAGPELAVAALSAVRAVIQVAARGVTLGAARAWKAAAHLYAVLDDELPRAL
jgi:hypothetical protein